MRQANNDRGRCIDRVKVLNEAGKPGTESPVAALARTAMAHVFAAKDPATTLQWLERAHRLIPADTNTTLTLASSLLAHDPPRAATLFLSVLDQHDVRQAWLGLITARQRLGDQEEARRSLATMLSRHAFAPDVRRLAEQIGGAHGSPGWCALRSGGTLEVHSTSSDAPRMSLDGKRVLGPALPDGWERARTVEVRNGNRPLLGSPIQIASIRRLAGCVEVWQGGIRGWAWHPADPETAPMLTLVSTSSTLPQTIIASDLVSIPDTGPLAMPRTFQVTRDQLTAEAGPIHVMGPDGKDLPGSPVDPFADEAAHVATALLIGQAYPAGTRIPRRAGGGESHPPSGSARDSSIDHLVIPDAHDPTAYGPALRADGPVPARATGADGRKRAVTIVMPVHNGGNTALACLTSVLATIPTEARVIVVDDGSSDPAVIAGLNGLLRRRAIRLIRNPAPLGFPAAANAGIRAASGRDIVLLNSDTLVPPGWLGRLRAAAYSSPGIGTVSPFSNHAGIAGYPGRSGATPVPDQATTDRLDRLAERANGGSTTDIPVAAGFCLYLRRDCLNVTGAFRADLFAGGHGEKSDFCLRARRLGWRNVALTGLFAGHLEASPRSEGAPIDNAAKHLQERNGRIVEQLHPGHDALIARFVAGDMLADARRRIDLLDWQERGRTWPKATILITHTSGGGVEQRLRLSVAAHTANRHRPIILRPAETPGGKPAIAVLDGLSGDFPNLVFAMPGELPALLRLLRAARPDCIEAHHFADYSACIYQLVTELGVPYDVHVHDYAWFCPRISLVGAHNRYCGEPDLHDCEACIADNGSFLKEEISVADLRASSARFLAGARRVVVPSDDTGQRMRRHFGELTMVTVPHEDDAAIPLVSIPRSARQATAARRSSVCVAGSIGVHKGYDILLACARDAARRNLDMDFIVVGHTTDDARLMETGRVFVTGRFEPGEAVQLIAAQNAGIGFVASICPETWCLSLGDLWRAGLRAAAFDIGAPAERIRRTGRGFLLPLALPASAINNALVAAMRTTRH